MGLQAAAGSAGGDERSMDAGTRAPGDVTRLAEDPSVLEAAEVVARLETSADHGLSRPEVAARLGRVGPNELAAEPPRPNWRRFLAQLHDPLIYLLLVAIVIATAAWWLEGATGVPFDTIVITVIVLLNAVLGFVQEARAEHAVEALQAMAATTASVIRDGAQVRVPTRELVPGDVLVLGEGDTVAADARLLSAATLEVAEASLTGESEPVLKDARPLARPALLGDRLNMVFNGTAVTQGVGRAVVTATGMDTEVGRIAGLLQSTPQDPTPLQVEIGRVGRMLGIAVVVIALVVIATVWVTFGVSEADDVVATLLLGVSLAVAAVPEGLPAILSVVLALGVQRMASRNAIVTELSSVETLGSASVICSDKTGTLTKGEMTVERVVTPVGEVELTGVGLRPEGEVLAGGGPLDEASLLWRQTALVVTGGCLANEATLQRTAAGWSIHGDPTEAAFLVAEGKLGTASRREERFERVGLIPFTSERKLMTSLTADREQAGRVAVVTKGAPDVLLTRCSQVHVGDMVVPLDAEGRARILADVERLSDAAYRTLAVAYRPLAPGELPADGEPPDERLEHDLVYTGMVAIIDPPRPEATDAIADARRAGIRVLMITGDHPLTAARIAGDLGITARDVPAVTGAELEALDDAGLAAVVRDRSVFARVAPEHKLRIVDALQAGGHVVAMTGDGVNDAPALRSADIGVAMGRTGTEVTKQAAEMILADDNFATIVGAVREGRDIFDNIRKFLRYLLSSNMGEVLTVFLGVVLAATLGLGGEGAGVVLPLLATQILWINLLTDTGPALAMGVDAETEDVMARPPRGVGDRVIDARMWGGVLSTGLVMAVVTLVAIDLYLPGGMFAGDRTLDEARTVGFTVLVLAQLFNAFNARSETVSALRRPFSNRWLWGAIALSAGLQVAVVHVPLLNQAFSTVPMRAGQWAVATLLASVVLWAAELRKLVQRRRGVDMRASAHVA
jgi:P-type Ca2+ transporter type 2C